MIILALIVIFLILFPICNGIAGANGIINWIKKHKRKER